MGTAQLLGRISTVLKCDVSSRRMGRKRRGRKGRKVLGKFFFLKKRCLFCTYHMPVPKSTMWSGNGVLKWQ